MSEMELLITIITATLLAVAFLAPYEIKKDVDAPNPFIIELFIIGGFAIFFAFVAIISPKTEILGANPFKVIAYALATLFFIFFLNLFLNRYHESISLSESFTKIRMKTFKGWTFLLTSLIVSIVMLGIGIIKLKFSR